jgi:hypothetical protein
MAKCEISKDFDANIFDQGIKIWKQKQDLDYNLLFHTETLWKKQVNVNQMMSYKFSCYSNSKIDQINELSRILFAFLLGLKIFLLFVFQNPFLSITLTILSFQNQMFANKIFSDLMNFLDIHIIDNSFIY